MNIVFDSIEVVRRRARAHDPQTSHAAAERSRRFAHSHCARILSALDDLGTATAHEIASKSGLTVVQVDRRLPELERDGRCYVITQGAAPLIRDGYRVWAVEAA